MKKEKRWGFTLLELLVGIAVLVILGAIGFILIKQVSQRTKVVVAKTSITQHVMLLDAVKSDINYYPPDINKTLESLTYPDTDTAVPAGYTRGWRGPYLKVTPIDPWGAPYFYRLICEMGTLFGPATLFRTTPPSYQNFPFIASAGTATIILENNGLTACSVLLNGVEVITESEFKMHDPYLEKTITLLSGTNILSVRARSNKSASIRLRINSPNPFSNRTTYEVGSYGSDKKAGGVGFAKDLTWITGQSGADF
ncbi:MAG: type II secretion system protein GspG [Candidatus Omnitrophica bacterium]|nr:type II secretion system protein GspG [Candidatus Omnitrophota bacterium]